MTLHVGRGTFLPVMAEYVFGHRMHPERGRVDWRRVDLRKAAALGRIEAVERYARRRSCRRAGLLGYFGERIGRCAGCEACARRPPVLARVWDRLRG